MASDPQPKEKPRAKAPEKEGIAAFLNPAEMHKLGRLVLLSRYTVEGNLAGAHRSPLRGPSSEFADHKSYGQGDDTEAHRLARARAHGQVFHQALRGRDEPARVPRARSQRLDGLFLGRQGPTKFQFACHLAAALGYVIVKARDSVGLFLHAEKVDVRMDAGNSFQHLNNMLKHVQSNPPGEGTGIAQTLHEIAGSVRRRALVVVISDLLGDEAAVVKALAHLRKQRHDVIVFQTLDPAEIDLTFKKACELQDLETGERLP